MPGAGLQVCTSQELLGAAFPLVSEDRGAQRTGQHGTVDSPVCPASGLLVSLTVVLLGKRVGCVAPRAPGKER